MSHENSITIRDGKGGWINVVGDEHSKLPPYKRRPLDGRSYKTMKEAVAAAKKRSARRVPRPNPRRTIVGGN